MSMLVCIPSRLGSTRLPGKPLLPIAGRPLVAHVVERARESGLDARVVVATDNAEIARAAADAGAQVVMTDPALPSGTDRVAVVAAADPTLGNHDVVINFQGDQPLLPGQALADLAAVFADPAVHMATLVCPLPADQLNNPHAVKVVLAADHNALYFSRAAIPHVRDAGGPPPRCASHVGVYAYRKATLARLAQSPVCDLEQAEGLEQLRALHLGVPIRCVALSGVAPLEINTPQDLQQAQALWDRAGGQGAKAYQLWCQDAADRPTLPFALV